METKLRVRQYRDNKMEKEKGSRKVQEPESRAISQHSMFSIKVEHEQLSRQRRLWLMKTKIISI